MGGAERVLLDLHQIFPDAPIYTLVHSPKNAPWAKGIKIINTFFNHLPYFRDHHEILFPLAPMAFETFNFDNYDLVISITSAEAKSVITKPKTLHICYCLTPNRYLWSASKQYTKQTRFGFIYKNLLSIFRQTDLVSSSRPDFYLSISKEVQKRVLKYYHRKSDVIHPSINYDYFSVLPKNASDYFLVVSRLVPYKKVNLVIDAFQKLDLPLVIIGEGSQRNKLQSSAKSSKIKFLGLVSDDELRNCYSQARAVIFPQIEDFGLVPLEANAAGTPVIALAQAGALETVVKNKTGILFERQTVSAIKEAVEAFIQKESTFSSRLIRLHAKKFSQQKFRREFSDKVNVLCRLHQSLTS